MNRADDDDMSISVNTKALLLLTLKVILTSAVLFIPVDVLYACRFLLYSLYGPPSPASVPYVIIVCLLVAWYVFAYLLVLPHLGKRIENYVRTKRID